MKCFQQVAIGVVTWLGAWGVCENAQAQPMPAPLVWSLPSQATLVASAQDGERLDIFLDFGVGCPARAWLSELRLEDLVRAALWDAAEDGRDVTGVLPWAACDGAWVPLPALLPAVTEPPMRAFEAPRAGPAVPSPSVGKAALVAEPGRRRRGALSGKVVYVSASHGFTWTSTLGRWATQRGNTHDIVEDLVSAETVDQLMVAYLENAGATVFTVRERDMNEVHVIVDADAGGVRRGIGSGSYTESGGWHDVAEGFASGFEPFQEGVNPFALGKSRETSATRGTATAQAAFAFEVEKPGDYVVYAAWVADATRVPDAHYVIEHDGGTSHVRVNQRRHGGTWFPLGRFRFAHAGRVTLHNDSENSGSVSSDAVRIGGGMGDVARGDGTGPATSPRSNRPRWEENARYHIQFSGAPASVYRYTANERDDDVGARSRYAAWQNEVGEDAVYVAWHTNAPSPATGTVTYVYGPNAPDGSYDFTGVAGSDRLARWIQDELIGDLRAAVDPTWKDRGVKSAYFGELNKNHNPEMPSALVEVAFHDTASDATHLKSPTMRAVAARAFAQGIVRYFAERDGIAAQLAPEPPVALRVSGLPGGKAALAWGPGPADEAGAGDLATGYRVYRSADGRAFDDGVEVEETGLEVEVPTDRPTFFRVAGVNAGGESLPGPVVAVLPPCDAARPRALLVHGFYRLDAAQAPREDLSTYGLGDVTRVFLSKMNRFDALVAHAWALAAADLPFDSAEAPAVAAGTVALADYGLVAWALGEESTADETLSDAEQARVTAFWGPGKVVMLSGAELAWDLGAKGSASDQAFLAGLGVRYEADSAGTFELKAGTKSLVLDDGTLGAYRVEYPDVLELLPGAEAILGYVGGAGGVAGASFVRPDGGRALTFGVPLDAVFPETTRDAWIAELVTALPERSAWDALGCAVTPEEPEEPEVPDEPEGPDVRDEVMAGQVVRTSALVTTEESGCAGGGGGTLWSLSWLMGVVLIKRRRAIW